MANRRDIPYVWLHDMTQKNILLVSLLIGLFEDSFDTFFESGASTSFGDKKSSQETLPTALNTRFSG